MFAVTGDKLKSKGFGPCCKKTLLVLLLLNYSHFLQLHVCSFLRLVVTFLRVSPSLKYVPFVDI